MHASCLALLLLLLACSCVHCMQPHTRVHTARATDEEPLTVHLVFGSHLDVGYGGLNDMVCLDHNIINAYFHRHIPRAIRLAAQMREATTGWLTQDRFVYTTHSWLIALYLDCPAGPGFICPRPEQVEALKAAITAGDITWHAFPFNTEPEMYDRSLFEYGLNMTHSLDDQFGLPHKKTLSQRDVPSMTRGVVPLLAKAGVAAISVGVNWITPPPAVPHFTPFIWRDNSTGTQVIGMWHPSGYGGMASGIAVDSWRDCIKTPGFNHVLCVAWRTDNQGPPDSIFEIGQVFMHIRDEFPGARVVAGTFDNFTNELLGALPHLNLPVVTEELGDTWLYGVGSDPLKIADMRAGMRARRACMCSKDCDKRDPGMGRFNNLLLKPGEHTWGLAIQVLDDWYTWSNADLAAARQNGLGKFALMEESWARQANYTQWGVQQLPQDHFIVRHFLADRAARTVTRAPPGPHAMDLTASLTSRHHRITTDFWTIELDTVTGDLTRLERRWSSNSHIRATNWAGPGSALARALYSTYTEQDFLSMLARYTYIGDGWDTTDFSKPNVSSANPRKSDQQGNLMSIHQEVNDNRVAVHLQYTFAPWAVKEAGAPAALWVSYHLSNTSEALDVEVTWINKTTTRLPEALWVRFKPAPAAVDPDSWRMDKLGSSISPLEVIRNGSLSQHAVSDDGVSVESVATRGPCEKLRIRSLDAALVSPGTPSPFPTVDVWPDMTEGMSFNLYNNAWGTNYVEWYPYSPEQANMKFRFQILVTAVSSSTDAVQRTGHEASAAPGRSVT